MSVLIGLEFHAEEARLSVVNRRGIVTGHISESLSADFGNWWEVHPDQHFRVLLLLLERAAREGLHGGSDVAAIGLTGDPALCFLSHEMTPMKGRDLPLPDDLETGSLSLSQTLEIMGASPGNWTHGLAAVFSTLDYLRF